MKTIFLFIFTLLVSPVIQSEGIETLQLHHRSADSLLPIIAPVLGDSSAITGSGYKLFFRSSSQEATDIRSLVKQLDVPLKQVMVSVFHGSQRETEELSRQFSIRYTQKGGIGDLGFKLSTRDTHNVTTDSPLYQLKILDGYAGYIETGKTIPESYQRAWVNQYGEVTVETDTERREYSSGFEVLPRIRGTEVTLEISPYKSLSGNRYQSETIHSESLSTTLTGKLGQWLEIAGQQTEKSSNGTRSGVRYQTREQESSRVWVRADLIH
ncbi:MAG: hypothetical protein V3V12_02750 [Gammaproteobacteria bacterium]